MPMGIFGKLPLSWSGDYEQYYAEKPKPAKKSIVKKPQDYKKEFEEIDKLKEHRIALQKYSEKLKNREKEIKKIEQETLEKIKIAQKELEQYSESIYNLEYKVMDYVKRFEKKEAELFKEIVDNANTFKNYLKTASEAGFDFEEDFSKALIGNEFYDVCVTQKSNDFGADVIAFKDGIKYVIQCKKYSSAVGVEAVQQAFASKVHYKAHIAVVATNSVFTLTAKVLAEETGVLLWDGSKTNEMFKTIPETGA